MVIVLRIDNCTLKFRNLNFLLNSLQLNPFLATTGKRIKNSPEISIFYVLTVFWKSLFFVLSVQKPKPSLLFEHTIDASENSWKEKSSI